MGGVGWGEEMDWDVGGVWVVSLTSTGGGERDGGAAAGGVAGVSDVDEAGVVVVGIVASVGEGSLAGATLGRGAARSSNASCTSRLAASISVCMAGLEGAMCTPNR